MGTFISEVLKDNTDNNILSNEALDYVSLYSIDNGELIVRITGVSTNALGIFSITDSSINTGTTYKADWKVSSQLMGRMPEKAAI